DVEPPLTPEVLKITHWVADYYATPWGEVMRAALPAGINATVEQTVSITPAGREQLESAPSGETHESLPPASAGQSVPPAVAGGSAKLRALRLLADEGEVELGAFRLRVGATQTPKWLRDLEHEGLIERSYRTRLLPTRAKRRRAVRL